MEELLQVNEKVLKKLIAEKKTDDISTATIRALTQMKQVLESGSGIKGFNRKVQLKPLKWETPTLSPKLSGDESPSEKKSRRTSSNISDRTYIY